MANTNQRVTVESLIPDGYAPSRYLQQGIQSNQSQLISLEDSLLDVVREASQPYQPLISYFHGSRPSQTAPNSSTQANQIHIRPVPATQPGVTTPTRSIPAVPSTVNVRAESGVDEFSFARTPAKAKPCGSCPAMKGGLCKCAMKRAGRRAS